MTRQEDINDHQGQINSAQDSINLAQGEKNGERDVDFRIFMAETVIYRKEQASKMEWLGNKIDKMLDKFELLPCKERGGWYISMGRQMGFMWLVLSIILVVIVGSAWRGLEDRNTILKDISQVKSLVR